jgi:putative flippase GtrA
MSGTAGWFEKHREGILYLRCGALTVLVSWGSYAVLVWMGTEINMSNVLSWIFAVSFAFALNKWLVFRSYSLKRSVLAKEISSFFFLRILTGLVAIFSFPFFYDYGLGQPLFGVDGFIAKITVSIIEIALNYAASKYIVFRSRKEKGNA